MRSGHGDLFVGTNFGTRLDGGKVKTQIILGGSLTQVAFPLVFFGSIIVAIWNALQFSRDQRVVEGADAATLPSK